MTLLIGFFTFLLILVSVLMILIILMQRPRSDSGLGAALGGGGAAESAFGAETGNILSRGTIYCSIFFFVASFGLYLTHMYANHSPASAERGLPEMRAVGTEPAPDPAAGETPELSSPQEPLPEVQLETPASEPEAESGAQAEPASEQPEETGEPAAAEEPGSEVTPEPEAADKVSEEATSPEAGS